MPGFTFYQPNNAAGDVGPLVQDFGLASSKTTYSGDMCVRTVISSNIVVRPLTAADITASYQDGSANICGIMGVAEGSSVTTSTGLANSAPAFAGVNPATQCVFPLPTRALGNAPTDTGRSRDTLFLTTGNIIGGFLWENTTVTDNLRGTAVGILTSTINSVLYYFWSSAASVKVGTIEDVMETDALFNVAATANVLNTTHSPRCLIGVRVLGSYQQFATNFNYAT